MLEDSKTHAEQYNIYYLNNVYLIYPAYLYRRVAR